MVVKSNIHPAERKLHANTLRQIVNRLGALLPLAASSAEQANLKRRIGLYKKERQRLLAGSPAALARAQNFHGRFDHMLYCASRDLAVDNPYHPERPFYYEEAMPLDLMHERLAKIRTLYSSEHKPKRRRVARVTSQQGLSV